MTIDVLIVGQSNAEKWGSVSSSPPTAVSVTRWNGASFAAPTGNGEVGFGNRLASDQSDTVRIVNSAVGATALRSEADTGAGYWLDTAGSSIYDNAKTDCTSAFGSLTVDLVIWAQGERDAGSGLVTESEYSTSFQDFVTNQIRTDFTNGNGNFTDIPVIIVPLSRATGANDDDWHGIRAAQKAAAAILDDCWVGATTIDADISGDGIHYEASDYQRFGDQAALTYQFARGQKSYNQGPQFISATTQRSGATIVTLQHRGGSNFTPASGYVGWEVTGDGTFTDGKSEQGGLQLSNNQAIIYHTPTTETGREIRVWYGGDPATSPTLKDNTTDTLPLEWSESITATTGTPMAKPTYGANAILNTSHALYANIDTALPLMGGTVGGSEVPTILSANGQTGSVSLTFNPTIAWSWINGTGGDLSLKSALSSTQGLRLSSLSPGIDTSTPSGQGSVFIIKYQAAASDPTTTDFEGSGGTSNFLARRNGSNTEDIFGLGGGLVCDTNGIEQSFGGVPALMTMCWTWNQSAGTRDIYKDGADVGVDVGALADSGIQPTLDVFSRTTVGVTGNNTGELQAIVIFNKELSALEVNNLNTDPWAWVTTSASGSGKPVLDTDYDSEQYTIGSSISAINVTTNWSNGTTYTVSELPSGLSFDGTSITGTPAQSGTYSVVVTATNSVGSAQGAIPMYIGATLANDSDSTITRLVAAGGSEIISAPGSSQVSVNFPPGGATGAGLVSHFQYIQPNGIYDGHQGGLIQTFDPAANTNKGESKVTNSDSNMFVNANAEDVLVTVKPEINLDRSA